MSGQSSTEYAVLVTIVVAALVGMSVYTKRAISGGWRRVGDTFGHGRQYEQGVTRTPPAPTWAQAHCTAEVETSEFAILTCDAPNDKPFLWTTSDGKGLKCTQDGQDEHTFTCGTRPAPPPRDDPDEGLE